LFSGFILYIKDVPGVSFRMAAVGVTL